MQIMDVFEGACRAMDCLLENIMGIIHDNSSLENVHPLLLYKRKPLSTGKRFFPCRTAIYLPVSTKT